MKKAKEVKYNVVQFTVGLRKDHVQLIPLDDTYHLIIRETESFLMADYPTSVVMHNAHRATPEEIQALR